MRTIVLALLLASTGILSAQTRTLQDVARERKLGIRPPGPGTFSVTGRAGMPEFAPAAPRDESDILAEYRAEAEREIAGYMADAPVVPYIIGGGYNWQHRYQHGSHTAHVAPSRPAPPVVAPRPSAPPPVQHSSSGRTGTSGRRR